ncbi:MAG TPA: hypothetical protein ENN21_00435 [Spirochaetes bacterium]|nr:hypothetical protein [Spirochaetota bacterium]
MNTPIIIRFDRLSVEGYLSPTACGGALVKALPFGSTAQTWGDEIYFEVPLAHGLDDTAVETVSMGDLGYWPTGRALCVFFGPTPVSGPGEIRPASAVNIVGKVAGVLEELKKIKAGTPVRVEPA